MSAVLRLVAVGLAPCLSHTGLVLQCEYSPTFLTPECGTLSYTVSPRAISHTGVVAGHYTGCGSLAFRSFRWTPESGFQQIPMSGVVDSRASAISPNGEYIVGSVQRAGDLRYRAYIWKDGVHTFIEPENPILETYAYAVDDDGTVYGDLFDMWTNPQVFAWRDGAYLPLPPALEIEGQGDRPLGARYPYVVGWLTTPGVPGEEQEGFLWNVQTGSVELLPKLPKLGLACQPSAVNAKGQAVGYATIDIPEGSKGAAFFRPALWYQGTVTDIGTPPPHDDGRLRGINEVGQIVGQTKCKWLNPCPIPRAAVWINGERFSLMDFLPEGWPGTVTETWAINDHGVILAQGSSQGKTKGYIFTPIGLIDEDVTIDCRVDADDLLMLLDCWGPTEESPIKRADVDRDGVIGPADLALLLGAWSPKVEKKPGR